MSRPVDEKIVRMKFENQDFKAKAQETTGIFGKIKDSLNKIPGVNLGKTASELGAINKQAGMTDLSTLNNSVNTIADRFSVLGIIGVTALQNITNKAIDTGERMLKALTIDGAKTGFTEYELKIKSIQTMLTNTAKDGTTLEDINRELDALNEYADKTIYNFADMTKNIGLFTTAGVKLDTSVTAIKGLSNWAAASGASAEDASRGMYQLSQALSSGVVRLQDWKSLENANMGGAIFRDALLEQAEAFGKNVDMSEGFNMSLQQGWLTTDVLMKVLDDFSKREDFLEAATKVRTFTQLIDTAKESIGSGWAQTWEIVVGDFDEATKLWSSVSDVIGGVIQKSSDARNNTLKAFKDAGGFKNILDGIANTYTTVSKVFGAVKDSFRDIFPAPTVATYVKVAESFKNFSENLKISDEGVAKIRKAFTSFFELIKGGFDLLTRLGGAFSKLIPDNLIPAIGSLLSKFVGLSSSFADTVRDGGKVGNAIDAMGNAFEWLGDKLERVIDFLSGGLKKGLGGFTEHVPTINKLNFASPFEGVDVVKVERVSSAFERIRDVLKSFKDFALDKLVKLKDAIGNISLTEILGGGFLVGGGVAVSKIVKMVTAVTDVVKEAPKYRKMFETLFTSLGDTLEAFQAKAKAEMLVKVATSLLILAISLKVMEGISIQDTVKGLAALGVALAAMNLSVKQLDKLKFENLGKAKLTSTILAMGVAMMMFAGTIKKLGRMDPKELAAGVIAFSLVLAAMVGAITVISKSSDKFKKLEAESGKIVTSMIGIGIVVAIVASAIKKLGVLNADQIVNGTTAIIAVLAVLVGSFLLLGKMKLPTAKDMAVFKSFTKSLTSAAIAIAIFSISLSVMAGAIKKIGEMDVDVLTQGLLATVSILMSFAIFQKMLDKVDVGGGSIAIAIMAASLTLLLVPLYVLGSMNINKLTQGLLAMLTILAGVSTSISIAKDGLKGALGMAALIGALNLLVPVLVTLGFMPLKKLAVGLLAVGGSLAAMVLALNLSKGTAVSAAGLLALAIAMNFMIVPLTAMAAMGMGGVKVALLGLAGVLAILGGAALLLSPAVPVMLAVAVGIAAIGAAVLLAGAGLSIFTAGLVALAGVSAMAIASFIAAFGILTDSLSEMVPKVGRLVTVIIDTILDVLINSRVKIVTAAVLIVEALLTGVVILIPKIITLGVALIVALMEGLSKAKTTLIFKAIELMREFIATMSLALQIEGPKLIAEFMKLIGEIVVLVVEAFFAVADGLVGWIPGAEKKLKEGLDTSKEAIRKHFDGEILGKDLTMDLDKGLKKSEPVYRKNGKELGESLRLGVDEVDMMKQGKYQADQYVKGASSKKTSVFDIGKILSGELDAGAMVGNLFGTGQAEGGEFASGLESTDLKSLIAGLGLSEKATKGLSEVEGFDMGLLGGNAFVDGLESQKDEANTAGKQVVDSASKGLKNADATSIGSNFIGGFINGMKSKKANVAAAARDLGNTASGKLGNVLMVRSPSRVAITIGKYVGDGLVIGLKERFAAVSQASKDMANKAKDGISAFIDEFANGVASDDTHEIKFKPVVDLDNFDPSDVPDGKIGMAPNLSPINAKVEDLKARYARTVDDSQKGQNKKIEHDIKLTNDVNIVITGADALMQDYEFVQKLKSVILNEVTIGNRTIPNRMSIIPL